MHMDMSQETFCAEIYPENARPVSRDTHFVRACAVKMHMDISQEAFCATSTEHRALTLAISKNSFSVATLFGEI